MMRPKKKESSSSIQRSRKKSQVAKEKIQEAMERLTLRKTNKNTNEIPSFLIEGCEYLKENCNEEGLFRVSGPELEIVDLKKKWDEGKKVAFDQYSIHSVANVIKRWFRETPESILTDHLYEAFLAAVEIKDEEEMITALNHAVFKLPELNRNILLLMCKTLHRVCKNEAKNKMGYDNMSIVWGPTLVRKTSVSALHFINIQENAQLVVRKLIEHYLKIFEIKQKTHMMTKRGSTKEQTKESELFYRSLSVASMKLNRESIRKIEQLYDLNEFEKKKKTGQVKDLEEFFNTLEIDQQIGKKQARKRLSQVWQVDDIGSDDESVENEGSDPRFRSASVCESPRKSSLSTSAPKQAASFLLERPSMPFASLGKSEESILVRKGKKKEKKEKKEKGEKKEKKEKKEKQEQKEREDQEQKEKEQKEKEEKEKGQKEREQKEREQKEREQKEKEQKEREQKEKERKEKERKEKERKEQKEKEDNERKEKGDKSEKKEEEDPLSNSSTPKQSWFNDIKRDLVRRKESVKNNNTERLSFGTLSAQNLIEKLAEHSERWDSWLEEDQPDLFQFQEDVDYLDHVQAVTMLDDTLSKITTAQEKQFKQFLKQNYGPPPKKEEDLSENTGSEAD